MFRIYALVAVDVYEMKPNLVWIALHTLAILFISISLLTGLRIAMVSRPEWLWLSPLLPQGNMHFWHALAANGLTAVVCAFLLYQAFFASPRKPTRKIGVRYYRYVTDYGYLAIGAAMCTGWLLYFDLLQKFNADHWHFFLALAVSLYIVLHAVVYLNQYGMSAIKRIFLPNARLNIKSYLTLAFGLTVFGLLRASASNPVPISLTVTSIDLNEHIAIDGHADEPAWQSAKVVKVTGYGGANFEQGRTQMHIRALENGSELFLHVTWADPSQSLQHLPLIKRASHWQVLENGFFNFDEQTYYEDKLGIILADTCQWGAAATAHLGPKPLADRPGNWHGKGYHYSPDTKIRDLWHWKAVRTNDMFLADDNFIGAPDIERPGNRRYSAGYLPDPKQAGNYLMNWQWYRPTHIEPKRLPKDPQQLAPYQEENVDLNWIAAWFEYTPYDASADHFPEGTLMPSVFYESDQFEGDRADVRARGIWQDGWWSLELVRKLDTSSDYDIQLTNGTCLWIAAFDHAQIAHTRHNRPLRLVFERQP